MSKQKQWSSFGDHQKQADDWREFLVEGDFRSNTAYNRIRYAKGKCLPDGGTEECPCPDAEGEQEELEEVPIDAEQVTRTLSTFNGLNQRLQLNLDDAAIMREYQQFLRDQKIIIKDGGKELDLSEGWEDELARQEKEASGAIVHHEGRAPKLGKLEDLEKYPNLYKLISAGMKSEKYKQELLDAFTTAGFADVKEFAAASAQEQPAEQPAKQPDKAQAQIAQFLEALKKATNLDTYKAIYNRLTEIAGKENQWFVIEKWLESGKDDKGTDQPSDKIAEYISMFGQESPEHRTRLRDLLNKAQGEEEAAPGEKPGEAPGGAGGEERQPGMVVGGEKKGVVDAPKVQAHLKKVLGKSYDEKKVKLVLQALARVNKNPEIQFAEELQEEMDLVAAAKLLGKTSGIDETFITQVMVAMIKTAGLKVADFNKSGRRVTEKPAAGSAAGAGKAVKKGDTYEYTSGGGKKSVVRVLDPESGQRDRTMVQQLNPETCNPVRQIGVRTKALTTPYDGKCTVPAAAQQSGEEEDMTNVASAQLRTDATPAVAEGLDKEDQALIENWQKLAGIIKG